MKIRAVPTFLFGNVLASANSLTSSRLDKNRTTSTNNQRLLIFHSSEYSYGHKDEIVIGENTKVIQFNTTRFLQFSTYYVYRNQKCNKNKKRPKIRRLNIFVFVTYLYMQNNFLSCHCVTLSIIVQIFRLELFTQS